MMKRIFTFFCCLLVSAQLMAQTTPRFQDDIRTIKNYDKIYAAPPTPILFIGSSSIRKWDDLERNFAKYVVLNRGFGGAPAGLSTSWKICCI
jgi:hypothetical protein